MAGTTDLALTGDGLEHSFLIREQLDALNVLINWIFQECPHTSADILDMNIIPDELGGNLYLCNGSFTKLENAGIAYSDKNGGEGNETSNQ